MKQHITLEQLKEIDSDLIALKLVREGFIEVKDYELIRTNRTAKQFTIGKMIEILDNSNYTYDIRRCKRLKNWILLESIEHSNDVNLSDREINDRYDSMAYDSEELCDILWEAIKYLLKV